MRKFKFFALILSLMALLGAFAACNPENSSSESSTPTHTCESVCEECGKCTNEECTDDACEQKCECEAVDPEPDEPSNDTQAMFATFEKTGDYEYFVKVSNSMEALALDTLVSVNATSVWTLSSDANGNEEIADKIAMLEIGDNTYYVLVKAEDNSTQLYTLKIRRKPMYTVAFDVVGGTSVADQQIEEDGNAQEPATTKVGYDFSGWNYDFTTPITENTTIVASWTETEYTISYNLDGGSVATPNPETYHIESGEITLTNPTREGCKFAGWTGTDLNEPTMSVIIYTGSTGNRTYVATWEYEEYTITYHLDGGTNGSGNPATYTIDTADITLAKPALSGYTFEGWYTSSDFNAASRISVITKGSMGDLNLYAKWAEEIPEVDNLPNVKITQSLSQYVTDRDYANIEDSYGRKKYEDFAKIAQPAYITPGLEEGLIPQGMDVWEEKNLLLISGYFADSKTNKSGSPSSMLVAVDLTTGKLAGKYCLKNSNGSYHTGHVGGVAVTEKNVYIGSSGYFVRISLAQIERVGKTGELQFESSVKVPAICSFCNYSNGVLWVGDFVNSTETPKLPAPSVGSYTAWVVGYKVKDTETEFSSENWDKETMTYATPDYALSITNKVQGFTFVGDKIVLSTSYGRNNNATIYIYNNPLNSAQDTSIEVNGTNVPVWVLDGTYQTKSYTTMPMSEAVTSYNGKALLIFETGTLEYNNAKAPTDHIWSITIS